MSTHYQWQGNDLTLFCHIQANAKRSAIVGIHNQRLKIAIAAPAIDGKANAALLQFLAQQFVVAKQQVSVCKGETNKFKTVKIAHPQSLPTEANINLAQHSVAANGEDE